MCDARVSVSINTFNVKLAFSKLLKKNKIVNEPVFGLYLTRFQVLKTKFQNFYVYCFHNP